MKSENNHAHTSYNGDNLKSDNFTRSNTFDSRDVGVGCDTMGVANSTFRRNALPQRLLDRFQPNMVHNNTLIFLYYSLKIDNNTPTPHIINSFRFYHFTIYKHSIT